MCSCILSVLTKILDIFCMCNENIMIEYMHIDFILYFDYISKFRNLII